MLGLIAIFNIFKEINALLLIVYNAFFVKKNTSM